MHIAAVNRALMVKVVELLTKIEEPIFVEFAQRKASGSNDFSHITLATLLGQAWT
jgi:hypothetical protein